MDAAVRLRALGWSLRKIGTRLGVSAGTVHSDLARWERQQIESLIADVQPAVQSRPPGTR
jgi:DNA-directed RNA polymerase specialized sigma24 family protein